QQLVRQQLKLRLLNARQALLARNDRLFRADLGEAQSLMQRYLDTRQASANAALATVKQLVATPLSVDSPQINTTPAARRARRARPRDADALAGLGPAACPAGCSDCAGAASQRRQRRDFRSA